MTRIQERVLWLMRRMTTVGRTGFIVAWDEETVDAFVLAFPEAQKVLRHYLLGPHSSPMLNATAKRAMDAGYITPGHIGNEGARQYNQRTWCRTWRITAAGRIALVRADQQSPDGPVTAIMVSR
jgi:hypothetical protein